MEPEGSLTCLQEPSSGPYPEPHPISLWSILILSTHLRHGPNDVVSCKYKWTSMG
jgi:hypothetical protein